MQTNLDAIRLLSLLCLLPDGAERSSLYRITAINHPDSAVRTLKAVSLIYEAYSRLRVLSPIREYIHRRSDLQIHEDDRKAVIQHYINLASKGVVRVESEGFITACEILPPERGNLHSVLSLAIRGAPPSSELAATLEIYGWFLSLTSPSVDLLKQLVGSEDWERHLNVELQANIRLCLAEAYRQTGAPDQSLDQLAQGRALYMKENLSFEAAESLQRMGWIFLRRGESKKAMGILQAAKEEFASIGSRQAQYREVCCMNDLGYCLISDGQHEEARVQLSEVSELLKQKFPEKSFRLADVLCVLSQAHFSLGDLDSAASLAKESLVEMVRLGSARGRGRALRSLGKTLLKKGELETSIGLLEEAIPLLSNSVEQIEVDEARELLNKAVILLNNVDGANESTLTVM